MNLERLGDFETVVSRFQLRLLVDITRIFHSHGMEFLLEVEYKIPGGGEVTQETAFVAEGMPFQIELTLKSEKIAVDIYVDGADAYLPENGQYNPRAWQIRYERYDFDNLNELADHFSGEVSKRILQLQCHE